jgi:glutamate synthase domain-containing protein 3
MEIDALGLTYRELNASLNDAVQKGADRVVVRNVNGQRYIGTNLHASVTLELFGTPGNDLGAFMNGPIIHIHGNGQDGVGNTMNDGEIVVHGRAGDALGLAARGGAIFVRDGAGYRAGIHMKEYEGRRPLVVVGGGAQDFLGEYMAGGVLVVLGLDVRGLGWSRARFIGTGMHGGVMYLRGRVEDYQLGKEVGVAAPDEGDRQTIDEAVRRYARLFEVDERAILSAEFIKLFPLYLRPYGRLYAY